MINTWFRMCHKKDNWFSKIEVLKGIHTCCLGFLVSFLFIDFFHIHVSYLYSSSVVYIIRIVEQLFFMFRTCVQTGLEDG